MYEREFNAEDYNVPDFLISKAWRDTSWRNDMYPSFTNVDLRLKIWVAEQYKVQRIDMDGCTLDGDIFTTEDEVELKQWLADFEKANPLVVVIFGDMEAINDVVHIRLIHEVKTVLLSDNPEAFNDIKGYIIPQMYDGAIVLCF